MTSLQASPSLSRSELCKVLFASLSGTNDCLNDQVVKSAPGLKTMAKTKKFGYVCTLTLSRIMAKEALTNVQSDFKSFIGRNALNAG